MADSKEIRYDSAEAATYKTGLAGWVSCTGNFWGEDEHMARWTGCTHQSCACGFALERRRVSLRTDRQRQTEQHY